MTMQRWSAVVAVVIGMTGSAAAGPIQWSFTSTGATQGEYWFEPGGMAFETPAGETQDIYAVTGVHVPVLVSPIPLYGPTLSTTVTLWDTASGEAYSFNVPIEFYDNEPAPVGEPDQHVPRIGAFGTGAVVLGGHKYTVTNGGSQLALSVRVEDTPEPSTLALAAGGIALVGWRRRLRNRR